MTNRRPNPKLAPRIIAGKFKGMRLLVPSTARPFTDRVKQSVFDTLGPAIAGTIVLDLFAGSGNLGFEALSRGAQHVTFVEISAEARSIIGDNALHLNVSEQVKLVQQPVAEFLKQNTEKFDVIFLDPPFEMAETMSLKLLASAMHGDSLAILKLPKRAEWQRTVPSSLDVVYVEELGQNLIIYLRLKPDAA